MALPPPARGPRKPIPWVRFVPTEPRRRSFWRRSRAAPPKADAPRRRRRRAREEGLGDCLLYPLRDGPGVGLLVFAPPMLWIMSLPVFDIVAIMWPRGHFNALALLVVPFALPLGISFSMTLGYLFLFLGQVLVSSALGEEDHPRWPEWDRFRIIEGLGRLIWASLIGLAVGAGPLVLYGKTVGFSGPIDRVFLAGLAALGLGYAQMALIAALVHDSLLAANPVTVVQAIVRIGRDYLVPWAVSGAVLLLVGTLWFAVLFRSPSIGLAAFGLWAFWVLFFYGAMVALRVLGLTYHRHAGRLGWFDNRPSWASSSRTGRIYVNS